MTWCKWWALEIVTGIAVWVDIAPLGWMRVFIAAGLMTLGSVFYFERRKAQSQDKR